MANFAEQVKEAFFYFDVERSGTIHVEELRDIVLRNGEAMNDVEDFIAEAQGFADGSGNIDYNAFADLMTSQD